MNSNYWYPIKGCTKQCKSAGGLTQHINCFHPQPPQPHHQLDKANRRLTHPHLTGKAIYRIFTTLWLMRGAQLARAIRMAVTYHHQLPLQFINPWMRHLTTHFTHLKIGSRLSLPTIIFPNNKLQEQGLIKPCSSGQCSQPKMASMMYPGDLQMRCTKRSIGFSRATIPGRWLNFIIKGHQLTTCRGGWQKILSLSCVISTTFFTSR